jgi:FMN-dependent oxidoreductase (nitrilotriacetate monooxygenase family)
MTDPTIPIAAMAAVTKNLAFAITGTTSFEQPFVLAKRYATLDHLTNGRFGWNIVTGYKKAAFKAIGFDTTVDHDERYTQAEEYMQILYKLWEGSWSDNAVIADPETDVYFDPDRIRHISHKGKYWYLETKFICSPSPQRTPFLFQAGASPAGSAFAARHAEGIFVSGHSPSALKPKIAGIRKLAEGAGRDPASIKFFTTLTPIIGRTEAEAAAKFERAKKYASVIGGLVLFSGWTGIDISKVPLDREIREEDSKEAGRINSVMSAFTSGEGAPKWTPRDVAEQVSLGGLGPVVVGTPATVAAEMERWIEESDLDGFNLAYVTTPGTFEDVVELLVPELRRRGVYPERAPESEAAWTGREKLYGRGQARLRDDHVGSTFRYLAQDAVSEKLGPEDLIDPVKFQFGF